MAKDLLRIEVRLEVVDSELRRRGETVKYTESTLVHEESMLCKARDSQGHPAATLLPRSTFGPRVASSWPVRVRCNHSASRIGGRGVDEGVRGMVSEDVKVKTPCRYASHTIFRSLLPQLECAYRKCSAGHCGWLLVSKADWCCSPNR